MSFYVILYLSVILTTNFTKHFYFNKLAFQLSAISHGCKLTFQLSASL